MLLTSLKPTFKALHVFYLTVVLLTAIGCAPSFGDGKLNIAPLTKVRSREPLALVGQVTIREFTDSRNYSVIGEIDGRPLTAKEPIQQVVQHTFERGLFEHGSRTGMDHGTQIAGTVKDWFVKVKPGFPLTRIFARAKLGIRVFEPGGVLIFQGTYEGASFVKHFFPNRELAESTLKQAMDTAILEIFSDDKFVETINGHPGYPPAREGSSSGTEKGSQDSPQDFLF